MTNAMDTVAPNPVTLRSAPTAEKNKQLLRYRLMIVWRFALAMFGGYAIAMYSAILIAQLFSEQRASAAMSATLIGFTLQACAFIWVFMVNKTLKASLGIIIPAVILFALSKVVGQ